MTPASRDRDVVWILCLAVAIVAAVELVAHAMIQRNVVPAEDWESAAAFVRSEFRPGDRLVAAPGWADPLLREAAGDLMSLESTAASDEVGAGRLWELSIRGAAASVRPAGDPEIEHASGLVTIRRWNIGTPKPLYDFVSSIERASVSFGTQASAVSCKWQELPRGGGGLGTGALAPPSRFVCDRRRAWLWVGSTVNTDLELQPRRCIWQHPAGRLPVRVTFSGVPLGDKVVLHGGLHYLNEREHAYAPVDFRVLIGGQEVGRFVHNDGDGWARYEISTSELTSPATVTFETTTKNAYARTFCWSGYTVGEPTEADTGEDADTGQP